MGKERTQTERTHFNFFLMKEIEFFPRDLSLMQHSKEFVFSWAK